MLNAGEAKYLTGKGPRSLRNTLVHYGVRGVEPSDILWDDPLLGLPQKFCDGQDRSELDSLVDRCAIRIRALLDQWRGPFTHLLHNPPDYLCPLGSVLRTPYKRRPGALRPD